MKPEAQQIAIAEECGWKMDANGWINSKGQRSEYNEALDVSYRVVPVPPPDYLKDLNAMHEALRCHSWEIFTCDAGYGCKIYEAPEKGGALLAEVYGDNLCNVMAEAFLRMLGKWVEE